MSTSSRTSAPPPPPPSGPACLCCANHGVLPPASLGGHPLSSTLVSGPTILQCCEDCIAALFFGGTHPHPISPLLRGAR